MNIRITRGNGIQIIVGVAQTRRVSVKCLEDCFTDGLVALVDKAHLAAVLLVDFNGLDDIEVAFLCGGQLNGGGGIGEIAARQGEVSGSCLSTIVEAASVVGCIRQWEVEHIVRILVGDKGGAALT